MFSANRTIEHYLINPKPKSHSTDRPMAIMEELKRAEDSLKRAKFQIRQDDQCIMQRVLEAGARKYGYSTVAEFTQSLAMTKDLDVAQYLQTPDSEGPFEVLVGGYYARDFSTIEKADAYAKNPKNPWDYAQVLNSKKEVLATYFFKDEPYLVASFECYDEKEDANVNWLVPMCLSLAEMNLETQSFETEEAVYQHAEEVLPDANGFTGQVAFVVAKLELDEEGRLLKHPNPAIELVYQYGDVFEYGEGVPEYFKEAHPLADY